MHVILTWRCQRWSAFTGLVCTLRRRRIGASNGRKSTKVLKTICSMCEFTQCPSWWSPAADVAALSMFAIELYRKALAESSSSVNSGRYHWQKGHEPAEPHCYAAGRLVACVATQEMSLFDEPPRWQGCSGSMPPDWLMRSSSLKHQARSFEARQPLLQPKSCIFGNDPVPPSI